MHLKFPFIQALHFSTLAMKLFNSGKKLRNTTVYELVSIQMLCYPYDTSTFKTNTLRLVSNKAWLKRLSTIHVVLSYQLSTHLLPGPKEASH